MTSKFIAALLVLVVTATAQDKNFFPKPSYFRETFSTPKVKVELLPPVRLSDAVVNGKLELSLRGYLELVMANNTDIEISRLSVDTARNAILRGHTVFDPLATANFNSTRTKSLPTDALAGASTLQQLSQPLSINYTQLMPTGTSYTVGFAETKSTSNSGFNNFNPAFSSNLQFSFSQPLLRNRGGYINRMPIMLAESRLRKTEYDLKTSVIALINTAELVYWQAVQFRENLRVQESNLDVADKFLKRSQRELELGAISKLDIYQPELAFVQAQASVSQARYQVLQQDDAIRKQIGADLDHSIRELPIVLTESPDPPAASPAPDTEGMVAKAFSMRPELKSANQNLDLDELTIRQASNALRPDLALTGLYTSQGRGGTAYVRTNVFNDLGDRSTITQIIPGGVGDAFDQMFHFGYPVYGFGLRLRLPIKNRQASADMADAVVAKRRDTLTIRSVEQAIRLDVLNAINQVESSKSAVDLAIKSKNFAQLSMDAENKKYELGTSTIFEVTNIQQALNRAESEVVNQSVAYRRNLLNLLRVTGGLLEDRGVAIK
jgi:outer membrane protein